MLERFDCKVGLKSPAHITMVPPFWMEVEKEEVLFKDVHDLCCNNHPFVLNTINFSAFKPRTIFIDLKMGQKLIELKTKTDNFFRNNLKYQIKIDDRPFHPHITIATRDLHKKTFHEAWPLFENKKFLEEWTVEGLSVLRHNKKNWDVINTSRFNDFKT